MEITLHAAACLIGFEEKPLHGKANSKRVSPAGRRYDCEYWKGEPLEQTAATVPRTKG